MLLGSPLYTHRHLPPHHRSWTPVPLQRVACPEPPKLPSGQEVKKTSTRADTERGHTTKLQDFFQRAAFWLGVERKLTNYSYSGIWQAVFLKSEQNKSVTSRKTIDSFVANDKIWASKAKARILENLYLPWWTWQPPQNLKDFSD